MQHDYLRVASDGRSAVELSSENNGNENIISNRHIYIYIYVGINSPRSLDTQVNIPRVPAAVPGNRGTRLSGRYSHLSGYLLVTST